MEIKDAMNFMADSHNIPKRYRYAILKEMEQMGLVILETRYMMRLINMDQNKILDNVSALNRELGMWQ